MYMSHKYMFNRFGGLKQILKRTFLVQKLCFKRRNNDSIKGWFYTNKKIYSLDIYITNEISWRRVILSFKT